MHVIHPRDAAVLVCTTTIRPGGRAAIFISGGAPQRQGSLL